MFESLAFALIKTVFVFVLQKGLEDTHPVKLKGMPKWYGEEIAQQACESGMARGTMPEALDKAIADASARLERRIRAATKNASEATLRGLRDEDERTIVAAFGREDDFSRMVSRSAVRKNQEYKDGSQPAAYARMCIAEPQMNAELRARFDGLARQLALHRGKKADKELDDEVIGDDSIQSKGGNTR